jgi:type I restriction enzyme, S subunit
MIVPPLDVQDAIVAHLAKATAKIRAAIADAQSEIALIQQFRTRLIADVVTGQFDVRALAATLPAVTEAAPLGEPDDDAFDDDAEALEVEEADA